MNTLAKLDLPVRFVKGVGPKKFSILKKLNIQTVRDLLYYFPRTYEDRRKINYIQDCKNGDKANLVVTVCGSPFVYRPRRGLSIVKIPVRDNTGLAYLVWFNQEYILKLFKVGEKYKVSGKVKIMRGEIQIQSPVFEKINNASNKLGKIVPIYPLTEGISNNTMIKIVTNALKENLEEVEEIIPKYLRDKYKLCDIKQALMNIHYPKDKESYIRARYRLAFEELFILQLGLLLIKTKNAKDNKGIAFKSNEGISDFINSLPFELTNAQKRVIKEIQEDMQSKKQMNRLVQGDVGSGKTIVGVIAMLKAYKCGYQSVMMAPTEILAYQHYEGIIQYFKNTNIRCKLLTGSIRAKEKKQIINDIKMGNIDVIIGTHALIQEDVEFSNLGLVITDEQHRFGVRQRAILASKGKAPDILVMTATPIPRTLALILYGDLDISIIDELPAGRKKIQTYAVNSNMRKRVYEFVKKQINQGRQAYIVCPLINESESLNIKSATEVYDDLKDNEFKNYNVGILHGKMLSHEKDEVMKKFKEGIIDILISTTVIEVGVNVPNANIIVIENAERFGLAQLHQLRGRVGRGEYQSYCILINESNNKIAKERMKIMERTTNGFVISEKDLQLRGPGEFFGTKQHGLPDLKIANIFTDIKILKVAQEAALNLLEDDPELLLEKNRKIKNKIEEMFKDKIDRIALN